MSLRDLFNYPIFDGTLPTPKSGCTVGAFLHDFYSESEGESDKMIMIYEGVLVTDECITNRVSAYIKSNNYLTSCNNIVDFMIDNIVYTVISHGYDNKLEVFKNFWIIDLCNGYSEELLDIDGAAYFQQEVY